MIYEVIYTKNADKSIAKFRKSNPIAYKKILELIKELHEHPRTGKWWTSI
jgi:toxin YoeB